MSNEEEENDKSIYNYNMIFNRINNYDDDTKINTDLINDIDLQNFDPKRYEYYTNLLYIYNKDPKTLYDLLNKYYNVKSMHQKEKGIIKYIYDYARKLKELDDDANAVVGAAGAGAGATGGGSRKRRNRQSGGVNTWQDKFIGVLKSKMPDKVKKAEPSNQKKPEDNADTEEDYYVELKDDKVEKLSKKIDELQNKITNIEADKKENKKNADLTKQITDLDVEIADLTKQIDTLNQPSTAVAKNLGSTKQIEELNTLLEEKLGNLTIDFTHKLNLQNTSTDANLRVQNKRKEDEEEDASQLPIQNKPTDQLSNNLGANTSGTTPSSSPNVTTKTEDIPLGNVIDELVNIVNVLTAQVAAPSTSPTASPTAALASSTSSVAAPASSLEVLNTLTNLADTLQEKIKNSPSEQTRITEKQEADLASTISSLQYLTTALISGGMNGGAGNSDEQLKMKYLDNNKYKEINTWKKLKELKGISKSQSDNVDENNKIGQLSKDIDAYNYSDKDENDTKYIIQQLNNFENDPKNPLDELAITFDDRIVFIIATFFIRYITIIIVQWCIDINIIKTFYEGFIYYAIIYIIIFWFIVLFINIDNSYDVKYMNFNGIINSIRTLFYYFYMGTNGISRLLVHTSLIIILIIIPIILNIKRKADYVDDEQTETEKILNNDERKQLSKSLSLFTMFIWLFTSIIATKF